MRRLGERCTSLQIWLTEWLNIDYILNGHLKPDVAKLHDQVL